jgi:hypothetical protein
MNIVSPMIGSQIRVGEGVLEDLLRRAVYGPDDQCLQPGIVCPTASIESRHIKFAATGVTGFMTKQESHESATAVNCEYRKRQMKPFARQILTSRSAAARSVSSFFAKQNRSTGPPVSL